MQSDHEMLARLARIVTNTMRPKRDERDDFHQTAWLAGLQAIRSANKRGSNIARNNVYLAMLSACWRQRLKCQPTPQPQRPAQTNDNHDAFEARDYLAKHWPSLSAEERQALSLVVVNGLSYRQTERVLAAKKIKASDSTLRLRVNNALNKLREQNGE